MKEFNLAYFLWIMKGSNLLSELSYYGSYFDNKVDDEHLELRGAYGPRLRNWVGPDQYQEMININKDIDDEREMKKPQGVDQLEKVYLDLKNGIATCCQIFDPSIDFEDTNYIPDLLSIGFAIKEKQLNMTCMFSNSGSLPHDQFFVELLMSCMASILDVDVGHIRYVFLNTDNVSQKPNYSYPVDNKTPESLWHDIHLLFDMEKHLRNGVSKESVNSSTVELTSFIDSLIEKFLNPIKCNFWQDYGYLMIIFVLKKYGGTKFDDYIMNSVLVKKKNVWKDFI